MNSELINRIHAELLQKAPEWRIKLYRMRQQAERELFSQEGCSALQDDLQGKEDV